MKQRPGTITTYQRQTDNGARPIIRGKVLTDEQYRKYEARWKAQQAFKRGWINKSPCYICGSDKSQKHHPDYERPLFVIWLCTKHHSMVDRGKLSILLQSTVSGTTVLTYTPNTP